MTRSGYTDYDDDCEYGTINLFRANVGRAAAGKRGQAFLRALRDALDAMPNKRLVAGDLETEEGEVCALGAVCRARGLTENEAIAESDWDELGSALDIAPMLAQEVMYENDQDFEYRKDATPEERWKRMRAWVDGQIAAGVTR